MKCKNISLIYKGITLGILWILEISVNNFFHPPLPGRDIFDDAIWAVVAIIIFVSSSISSMRTKKILSGVKTGFWLGLGSGIVACVTALLFTLFGMKYILSDPLVIAEWKDQMVANQAIGMHRYFVYQTLAGAGLHLVVLGIGMGTLLGVLGGIIGKVYD